MSAVYIPEPLSAPEIWYHGRRPTVPVRVNKQHPFARGLRRFWLGNSYRDLVGPVAFSSYGNGFGFDTYGMYFNSDNAAAGETGLVPVAGSQPRTFLANVYNTNAASSGYIFNIRIRTIDGVVVGGVIPSGGRWGLRLDAGKLRIEIEGAGTTSAFNVASGDHFIGCRLKGGTIGDHDLFVDGQKGSASGTLAVNTQQGLGMLLANRDINSALVTSVEKIKWAALWDRALSDEEIARIRLNPFQLLESA